MSACIGGYCTATEAVVDQPPHEELAVELVYDVATAVVSGRISALAPQASMATGSRCRRRPGGAADQAASQPAGLGRMMGKPPEGAVRSVSGNGSHRLVSRRRRRGCLVDEHHVAVAARLPSGLAGRSDLGA